VPLPQPPRAAPASSAASGNTCLTTQDCPDARGL
jgi:hypothetical protein